MSQPRILPNYPVPLNLAGNTHSAWYRYFNDLNQGVAPSEELVIVATGSPFTYQAPQGGMVIVSGGTVSAITFTRAATYNTGQTAGSFPVSAGDSITVTYSVLPTIIFAPQ
jgi:hypothetical protein